jgi:hypothetical protein
MPARPLHKDKEHNLKHKHFQILLNELFHKLRITSFQFKFYFN